MFLACNGSVIEIESEPVIHFAARPLFVRYPLKYFFDDMLYGELPVPTYTENDCQIKGFVVYNFVYEQYSNVTAI